MLLSSDLTSYCGGAPLLLVRWIGVFFCPVTRDLFRAKTKTVDMLILQFPDVYGCLARFLVHPGRWVEVHKAMRMIEGEKMAEYLCSPGSERFLFFHDRTARSYFLTIYAATSVYSLDLPRSDLYALLSIHRFV